MAISSLFLFQLSSNFLVYRPEENLSMTFVVSDMSFPYMEILFCALHTYTILINVCMALSPLKFAVSIFQQFSGS